MDKYFSDVAKDPQWCSNLFKQELIAVSSAYPLSDHPVMYFVGSLAKSTAAAYEKNIPGCSIPWEIFWSYDYGNDYFLGYPKEWGADLLDFGEEGLLLFGCSLTLQEYKEFVFQQHLQAIIGGASFLAYYLQMHGE